MEGSAAVAVAPGESVANLVKLKNASDSTSVISNPQLLPVYPVAAYHHTLNARTLLVQSTESENAEAIAEAVMVEVFRRSLDILFERHIEGQVLPYAVSFSRRVILDMVRMEFFPRDDLGLRLVEPERRQSVMAGSQQNLHEDEASTVLLEFLEPEPCPCDSWARGAVPVRKPPSKSGSAGEANAATDALDNALPAAKVPHGKLTSTGSFSKGSPANSPAPLGQGSPGPSRPAANAANAAEKDNALGSAGNGGEKAVRPKPPATPQPRKPKLRRPSIATGPINPSSSSGNNSHTTNTRTIPLPDHSLRKEVIEASFGHI